MNRTKRFFTMTCIGTGLVLGLAANALADDDDWGGVFLGVFPGIQIYSPPAYVVEQPPPPPPPGAYVYYGQPGPQDGYYYRHYRHGRDWREHRHHERHEDDDD
ncbi:MAG TPA: hypothetical protein VF811_12915 [Parasulfuritortus sp.]